MYAIQMHSVTFTSQPFHQNTEASIQINFKRRENVTKTLRYLEALPKSNHDKALYLLTFPADSRLNLHSYKATSFSLGAQPLELEMPRCVHMANYMILQEQVLIRCT